jgi:phosphatidylserine synthase
MHPPKDDSSENTPKARNVGDDGWISQKTRNQIDAIYTQSKSIPNLITLTRIASTPILSYLIIEGQYVYAMYGCILAGFSDLLDGYIARKYDMKTNLGTYLDPLGVSFVL